MWGVDRQVGKISEKSEKNAERYVRQSVWIILLVCLHERFQLYITFYKNGKVSRLNCEILKKLPEKKIITDFSKDETKGYKNYRLNIEGRKDCDIHLK